MKIFRDLLLVQRIEQEDKPSFIIPDSVISSFSRFKILEVGPDVKEDIKVGDIVLAEDMMEPLHRMDRTIGLLVSKYVMCVDEKLKL